ncbi:MAG: gliding motility protein GldM [Cytophagales bacterium]|nr:gliding motility protein GldM [Bernardetiaceae bacterium]MDW8211445.1 gliding motility protein GldM [Cytophagales bacterium]
MAGGKMTPRQAMINMMYLVLTALLALQVSNTVLEKFYYIDDSLRYANSLARDATKKVLEGMKAQVEKEGNKPKDLAIIKQAEDAINKTNEMMNYIEDIRKGLIEYTGGMKENGRYADEKNYDKSTTYLIGPEGSKSGKAYPLKEKLNAYAAQMSSYDKDVQIPKIALDAKEMPRFKDDGNQNHKDFALINFERTPLVACLAILSQFQSEVVRAESEVVRKLSSKVGGVEIKFDRINAMVSAESKIVAAGTKYRAKMFLAASASNISPQMSSTAGPVKVEDGIGIVEFTAQGGNYDKDGNLKKSWEGTIKIKKADGEDTIFRVKEEYIVAKPVVDIQAANVSALYYQCGNELKVNVPALGAAYNPSFQAEGAEVIKGANKGEVVVIPTANKVVLKVFSDGNLIEPKEFKVKLLPEPKIEILSGNKPLDTKNGGPCPPSIKARALADPSIREIIPKDASYRVTEWTVALARGRRLIIPERKFSGEEANLNDFRAQAKEGDRLIIEIKQVKRRNFKGDILDAKFSTDPIIYTITQ